MEARWAGAAGPGEVVVVVLAAVRRGVRQTLVVVVVVLVVVVVEGVGPGPGARFGWEGAGSEMVSVVERGGGILWLSVVGVGLVGW